MSKNSITRKPIDWDPAEGAGDHEKSIQPL